MTHLDALASVPSYEPLTDLAPPRAPKVDPAAWQQVCTDVLADLGVGVVGCDAGLRIVAATEAAAHLLAPLRRRGEPADLLPPAIARACREWMADARGLRARPVRLDSADGACALYVSFARVAGAAVSIRVTLRREVLRDDALLDALRDAWHVTAREYQLIALVRQGQSNRQIADTLGLTYGTVKIYLHQLFERLEIHTRAELIARVDEIRTSC